MKTQLLLLAILTSACGMSSEVRSVRSAGSTAGSFKPLIMGVKANAVVTELSGYAPMRVQLRGVYSLHDFGDLSACIGMGKKEICDSNGKNCVLGPKKSADSDKMEACLHTLMSASEEANHKLFNSRESVTHARFEWDFGVAPTIRKVPDSTKTFVMEQQQGFAAGYVYDKPGTYLVRLKVTNGENGVGFSEPVTIHVLPRPANHKIVYVSAISGNDSNVGTDQNHPVQTFARAQTLKAPGAEILFKRGEVFPVVATFNVDQANLRIASYGDLNAAKPILLWSTYRHGVGESFFLAMPDAANKTAPLNAVIEDLTLDTDIAKLFGKYADDSKNGVPETAPASIGRGIVDGLRTWADGILLRNVTLRNVGLGVQNEGRHDDILITQCSAPLLHGLRAYFAWNEGANLHLIGNRCANSTREHCARSSNGHRFTVHYANDFENLDQSADGYKEDGMKSVSNTQFGFHFTVRGNTFKHGAVSAGPLTGTDGTGGHLVAYGLIEDNDLSDGSMINTQHGLYDLTIRDNRITYVPLQFMAAIEIVGFDEDYQRTVDTVLISHNTIHLSGTSGHCLHEKTAVGVRFEHNLCTNSQLDSGGDSGSMLIFEPGALAKMASVSDNVYEWPKTFGRSIFTPEQGRVMNVYDDATISTAASWLEVQQKAGFAPDHFVGDASITNTVADDGLPAGSSRH